MSSSLIPSRFSRDLATLMSGTALAQALPMAAAPVMSRIFSPADYGSLALYMALTGILNVLVTSQYNHAIMLPSEDDDSINLVVLCVLLALGCGVVTLGLIVLYQSLHFVWVRSEWLYFVPLSVVLAGVSSALSAWTNKQRRYKRLSVSRVGQALVTLAVQLAVGLHWPGPAGLLLGLIGGQVTAACLLGAQVWSEEKTRFVGVVRAERLRAVARQHLGFARYVLPADLMNVVNNQVPTLLLARFASSADVGSYGFGQRILGLPSSLVASSIVDVFRERAIRDYNATGSCRSVYVATAKTLALLGAVPLLVLLIGAPELFAWVFGARWREAGVFAQTLSVMFYLRFVVSPLSYVYYIAQRQREDLALHVVMVLGTCVSLVIGYRVFHSPRWMIGLFSANYSLIYLVYLVRSYTFAGGGR